MNLHEYQVKEIFSKYGLNVPKSFVCDNLDTFEESIIHFNLQGPWVLKCQIHAGGRGKSGGVIIAKSKEEIKSFVKYWLGKRLITFQTDSHGQLVNKILIESLISFEKEFYFGLSVDRNNGCIACIVSAAGGINIEDISKTSPDLIHKILLDPLIGPQPYQGRFLGFKLGLNYEQTFKFNMIFIILTKIFIQYDLSLLEVNPLVLTENHDFICLDGKLNIDDNALFRQKELSKIYDFSQISPLEINAKQIGLNYIPLGGNIGCMVNGAGLAMATMDLIKLHGGEPANFLDIGGNINKNSILEAFKIIISNSKVKVILINIFGGIVSCSLVAESIVSIVLSKLICVPIIVRLEGNNADIGITYLIHSKLNITIASSLIDAINKAITVSG